MITLNAKTDYGQVFSTLPILLFTHPKNRK